MTRAMGSAGSRILIVGAGPTGLTLAAGLARHGIGFDIIDVKAAPERDSKALAINSASRYGFDLLDFGGEIGRHGTCLNGAEIHWRGKRLTAIDFRRASTLFGAFIGQTQAETERDLVEALARRGHTVEWRARLAAIEPHCDRVDVQIESTRGEPVQRSYAYVVGCDGKHSRVAPAIGAQFSVVRYPMHLLLGDFPLQVALPPDRASYFVWDEGFFILVPIGNGLWRVVLKRDGELPPQSVRAGEIEQVVAQWLGERAFAGPAVWLSRAPFYQRFTDRMRKGRMVLAGDSAHLYSPIGGTGMNAGMQDAFNLAWKLSLVASGRALPSLLDDYEAQRMEAMRANGAATDRSTRLISRLDTTPAHLEPFVPGMRKRKLLRHELPTAYSGLGLRYSDLAGTGALCRGLPHLLRKIPTDTRQLPDKLPHLHLLVHLVAEARIPLALADLLRATLRHADLLVAIGFGASICGPLVSTSPQFQFVRDDRGEFGPQLGLAPGEYLLAMPDGIVGTRGQLGQPADALASAIDCLLHCAGMQLPPPLRAPQAALASSSLDSA